MKYLLISVRDGYQVTFALAKADPAFSAKKIILANPIDNVPLQPEPGPFQIIVEGEKRKARFIRQVIGITVKSTN